MALSTVATRYAPSRDDLNGSNFPDAVAGSFLANTGAAKPPDAEPHRIPSPSVSYAQSKTLILDALRAFDPALAHKAKAVFDMGYDTAVRKNHIEPLEASALDADESRWRLRQVAVGEGKIMRSIEAGAAKTEYDPANPNSRSVIQLEYDSTVHSLIYMAHELGHSIADDGIRGKDGKKYGDNPVHMNETQAYFVQSLVYQHLCRHPDTQLARAAQQHLESTIAQNAVILDKARREPNDENLEGAHFRPMAFLTGFGLAHHLRDKGIETRRAVSETLLGMKGPQNIVDVLGKAGIEDEKAMSGFACAAMNVAREQSRIMPSSRFLSAPSADVPLRPSRAFQPLRR